MSLEQQPNIVDPSLLQQIEWQMVQVPAGRLEMRDDRTKQQWVAKIPSFRLSKYLVTQQLYESIMLSSPSTFRGPTHPVETVSWKETALFCNRISELAGLEPYYQIGMKAADFRLNDQANGYRLPTEAEWEYACRAGNPNIRYGTLEEIAWYKGNSCGSTQAVGQKQPNTWGLYDMIGNVWEWCSDIYDASVYGSYRIIRGGGWYDKARGCIVTNRRRSHPIAYKMDDLGFRLARNL